MPYVDTAEAARFVKESGDPSLAAIASEEAGTLHGLAVLARDLADQEENWTRFVVVSAIPIALDPRIPAKTSLVFSTPHRHGALSHCLNVLDAHGLNLTKLESRPVPRHPWEYLFYVDFEGAAGEDAAARAIAALSGECPYLKVLGSYPARTTKKGRVDRLPERGEVIVLVDEATAKNAAAEKDLLDALARLPGIEVRVHKVRGAEKTVTEVYLIGDTHRLALEDVAVLPGVERVVRVSEEYRVIGRHKDDRRASGFTYNGVEFSQDALHVFAGLCAVDTPENADAMFAALASFGQVTTRMGAYKPRTNPYAFQGHGKGCLPWVFEKAGKHGIRVIAMEITHESHIDEIAEALEKTGPPDGRHAPDRHAQHPELRAPEDGRAADRSSPSS